MKLREHLYLLLVWVRHGRREYLRAKRDMLIRETKQIDRELLDLREPHRR